jgi:hypothetical protein
MPTFLQPLSLQSPIVTELNYASRNTPATKRGQARLLIFVETALILTLAALWIQSYWWPYHSEPLVPFGDIGLAIGSADGRCGIFAFVSWVDGGTYYPQITAYHEVLVAIAITALTVTWLVKRRCSRRF